MNTELEKNQSEQNTDQQMNSREGYGRPQGNYQREYNSSNGVSQRPRIGSRPAYSSQQVNNDNEGFRPEGFGANLQGGNGRQQYQRPYRPRVNQGGYQPRQQQGYQPRQQGGYQQRPNYGNQGYQQQGYRPHYNQGENHGGYQQQSGYQGHGGYQPRQGYNQGYRQQNQRQRTPGYDPNAKYSLKKRIEYREDHIDPTLPVRLNKFLANAGVCSRREADEYIQAGSVTVNGQVVTELGTKVMRTDEVKFGDNLVSLEKKVYVLINKPKDYVTTSDDPQQRKTVMDLVKNVCPERIYPVGRLDRNTTGVLLLTNDGDLASKLTHPKFLKKKVYHVFLDKPVAQEDLQKIAEGIELEDGEIHADEVAYANEEDKKQVGIEIHSGKNRIVRRIFEHLGYRVIKLDRVQFAGLTKKNLRRGDWRFLTEKEVDMLRMGAFE
ncbi:MAG: RNA-binding S4 domain-containing protein [Prevotella nanceiensis]|nr:RNA-binding S4 domain-containing protein [Hoylesella nanceiensis]